MRLVESQSELHFSSGLRHASSKPSLHNKRVSKKIKLSCVLDILLQSLHRAFFMRQAELSRCHGLSFINSV